MTQKSSVSFLHGHRQKKSAETIKDDDVVEFSLDELPPVDPREVEQFRQRQTESLEPVDDADAPYLGAEAWKTAVRGKFYRPVKSQVTLRLDANTLDWFKRHTPKGYQTDINRVLAEYVAAQEKKAG